MDLYRRRHGDEHNDIALLLIDIVSDVNTSHLNNDGYEETALGAACRNGHFDVVKTLLTHEKIKDNIDICNMCKPTAHGKHSIVALFETNQLTMLSWRCKNFN